MVVVGRAERPCLKAFHEDRALPAAVMGPVEWWPVGWCCVLGAGCGDRGGGGGSAATMPRLRGLLESGAGSGALEDLDFLILIL